jgi:hypothetical protein
VVGSKKINSFEIWQVVKSVGGAAVERGIIS